MFLLGVRQGGITHIHTHTHTRTHTHTHPHTHTHTHTRTGNLTLSDARGMTSEGNFGSNPNPINYGLEAGDIVFAVFGSLFLVAVGLIVLLGFFIHPFFLS